MPVFGESKEDKLFIARLNEAVSIVGKKVPYRISAFLDGRQQKYARSFLEKQRSVDHMFWGGTEDCERTCVGIFSDASDSSYFDIAALTAQWYVDDRKLSHRDVLGTLIALGVKREFIGDIRMEDGRCVLFVKEDIADFIVTQTDRIGGKAVRMRRGFDEPLPSAASFEQISSTVASARLDCVIKALVSSGREDAAVLIKSGKVTVDYEETQNVSFTVNDGTIVSVRGTGKFIIDRIGPQTKRGRLFLSARKYI